MVEYEHEIIICPSVESTDAHLRFHGTCCVFCTALLLARVSSSFFNSVKAASYLIKESQIFKPCIGMRGVGTCSSETDCFGVSPMGLINAQIACLLLNLGIVVCVLGAVLYIDFLRRAYASGCDPQNQNHIKKNSECSNTHSISAFCDSTRRGSFVIKIQRSPASILINTSTGCHIHAEAFARGKFL